MVKAGLFLTLLAGATIHASAQQPAVKLYVFDCGTLKSGNPQPLLDRGVTTSVFGTIYEGITLDPRPALTANEARDIIARLSGAELPPTYQPELLVFPRDAGLPADAPSFVLAYRGRAFGDDGLRGVVAEG